MGTPRTTQKPVTRAEIQKMLAQHQQQNQAAQPPMFRAWSNFFFAIFSNPRTTLAGIGAAVPVLSEAYQSKNWVLGVAGLSTIMTGALAGDARKQQPPTDQAA